ncbi:MAG: HEPN domain-containing protein [Gammaproteobacteria bacterium]|nr:HEPN domain-containing protein [Gammaproteobacteria bacterium]MDD9856280.1 HEPN domain-containing protein [Gammaproteobacteria bacterium]
MDKRLVLAHWRRARQEAAVSDLALREDIYEPSISSAYYAIMHSANAVLQLRGIVAKSHNAVRNQFGKHLIKTGEIEPVWADFLSQHKVMRWTADYDIEASFGVEQAAQLNAECHQFIERMRRYLLAHGITSKELDSE